MKIPFTTWLAQFKHLAKDSFPTENLESNRIRFVYYDSGRSPEAAVASEMADRGIRS